MKVLEEIIRERGQIVNENVLKVDSIINHQVDPILMQEIANDICAHFKDKKITKVVTIKQVGSPLPYYVPYIYKCLCSF